MLLSCNWIKDLLPELDKTPEELAELLTLHSFEATVHGRRAIDPRVTVVKIEKLEPHPNADRLQLATVTDGKESVRVVCGAQNIAEGDTVPYAPPGTQVKDENGQPFKIRLAKIRGMESPGMLASPRELGLGESHTGIYILPADTPLGSRLTEHIPDDVTIEANITPNRAHDCLSHWGIAREVGALLNLNIKLPKTPPLPALAPAQDWSVSIEAVNDVWRYIGIVMENTKVAPSPLWMQARLMSSGVRPINNAVDITNYVMLETGNPTHAFDRAKLPGSTIGVRRAYEGEEIRTLDGESRTLTDKNLVIASDNQAVAVGGVIGGSGTQVTDKTSSILLESASFHAYTIQESARALKVHTESSARFSKDASPELAAHAAVRAMQLFRDIAGAKAQSLIDYYPRPARRAAISFRPERVSRLAGAEIPPDQSREILTSLRCEVDASSATWSVTPPEDRLDLTGEHDLAEEVVRVFGLNNIPAKPLSGKQGEELPEKVRWREAVRDLLAERGFTEDYSYSFEDEGIWRLLGTAAPKGRIKLVNPPSPDQAYLRSHLLPRLLGTVLNNKAQLRRKFDGTERAFFEIGTVFHEGEGGRVAGVVENEHVAAVVVGSLSEQSFLHETVNVILDLHDVTGVDWAEHDENGLWQGAQSLTLAGEPLGYAGMLNPGTVLAGKIGQPVTMLEIDLSVLAKHAGSEPSYRPHSPDEARQFAPPGKFPPTFRDISIIVAPEITADQVEGIIERAGGKLVERADLFDEYEEAAEGKKSLAFHIMYQSRDHTLTNEEVAETHNKIVATLKEELGAGIKGE